MNDRMNRTEVDPGPGVDEPGGGALNREPPIVLDVPRRLRELRRAAGLTQEELARQIGVNLRTVQRVERADGRGEWPTRHTLVSWERVCRARAAVRLVDV